MPPVACPGIFVSDKENHRLVLRVPLWQNTIMNKWLWALLACAVGIGLGLLYGWVIEPVDFVNLPPETLRADFRADYILMVAEAYQSEQDLNLAARRLAIFGSDPPADIASFALLFGPSAGFSPSEVSAIETLVQDLRGWQPSRGVMP